MSNFRNADLPIMQGFRSAFKFAELRRRDLRSSSFEQRAHLPPDAPPKCVWVQSQAFPFELARIGQRSSEVQGSAAVASENLRVLATQLLV